jgi:lysozyme
MVPMKANEEARKFIKDREGLRLKAYLCTSKRWTIGWGHTGDVKQGDTITAHQAEAIFDVDIAKYEDAVAKMAPKATENQFSALVSFAYNCGIAALQKSTLLRKFNAGDLVGASAEFGKWVRNSTGAIDPGLVKRRELEKALFLRA